MRGARRGPEDRVRDIRRSERLEALIRFDRALFVTVKAHEAELGLDQPGSTLVTRIPVPSRSSRSVLLSIATAALLAQ